MTEIDASGRNPTQRRLDDEGRDDLVDVSWDRGRFGAREEADVPDMDEFKGKAKQMEGKLTGDDSRRREGKAQESWGSAKDKAGDAWDEVEDRADDAGDRLT